MKKLLRTLVVEDSEDDALLIVAELERGGYEVVHQRVESKDGMAEALESGAWDIVISDYALPGFSAEAALEFLRQAGIDIPFILVSGVIGEQAAVACLRGGAHDFVMKDNLARLVPAVERELRDAEQRRERAQLEEELLAERERFGRIIQTAEALIMAVDTEGRITLFNRKCQELTGLSANEVLGRGLSELAPGTRWASEAARSFGELADVGETQRFEWTWLDGEGQERIIAWRPTAIIGDDGSLSEVVVMGIDITERKRAERALRESETRYRTVFENTGTATCLVAADGTILLANDEFAELSGYSRAEIEENMKYRDFVSPDDLDRVRGYQEERRRRDSEVPTRCEFDFVDRAGQIKRIDLSIDMIPGTDTSVASLRDISGRKRAEEALRESEARFRELADMLPQVIFETDVEGNLTFVNRNAFETFGYDESDLDAGLNAVEMLAPEDRRRAVANMEVVLSGREDASGQEYRALRKDGTEFPVLIYASAISREEGVAGLRGILLDISERKELQRQLEQSQRMEAIGELAGGIAHDFNNLLTVILGHAGLAQERSSGAVREHASKIATAADKAAGLTRQLLAFGRKQTMSPETVNLSDIVADMQPMLERVIEESVELVTDLGGDLGNVRVDPVQIEQVLMNLVVNARDAMPEGGTLTISTENAYLDEDFVRRHPDADVGARVLLSVQDTGIGMDEETQSRIFEPFFSTKPEDVGTGLGLATTYGIVRQSGGSIHVESEPEEGTTFRVYLPRVEEVLSEVAEDQEVPEEALHGSETVLVVEDEELVRQMAVAALEEFGYTVISAERGAEALDILEQYEGDIDVLVTDMVMPGIGGIELAQRARDAWPEIEVLYTSGYVGTEVAHVSQLKPGDNLLEKPFKPVGLVRKVRQILDAGS